MVDTKPVEPKGVENLPKGIRFCTDSDSVQWQPEPYVLVDMFHSTQRDL